MPEPKIDQQAIAEKLGVSRSTVTRVLRHDPSHRIASSTRKVILQTAKEMGYVLRKRKTSNIAFVVCGEMASLQHELHMAVCTEAFKSDYRVFLVMLPDRPTYKQLSAYANPLSADGIIIIGQFAPELIEQLDGVLPVAVIDGDEQYSNVDTVQADYIELGRMLTQHILDLGHRDIAVIVQFPWDINWTGPMKGVRVALEQAGIEPDLSRVWSKSGKLYPELLKEILASKPTPTAILALTTSDHAIILSTLMAMGVDVPKDLSYIGWAAAYMAALLPFPTVTCLDDLFESIASEAVHRLLQRTDHLDIPTQRVVVPVKLRVGETCISNKQA